MSTHSVCNSLPAFRQMPTFAANIIMIKFTLGLLCTILLAFTSSAQVSWQQAYPSAAPNYTLASTRNGYAFAHTYTPAPGTLLMSPSGGASGTWTTVAGIPAGAGSLYASNDALFLLGQFGIMRSVDNGTAWQSANRGLIGNDSTNLQSIVHVFGNNLILLHKGSSVNKVYYSSDNGLSWSATLNMFGQSVGSVVVWRTHIYLVTSGTVYVSDDSGGYWDNLYATFPAGAGGGATVAFSNGLFLMRSGTKFYTSANEGVSWTLFNSTGLPTNAVPRRFIKSPASDTIYMSTQITSTTGFGVYYSADRGATWNPFDNGLPANRPIGAYSGAQLLIAHDGYMLASPDSSGIYRTADPVTASRVVRSNVSVVSVSKKDINLSVYPNPALQTLDVSFSLANAGNCTVSISDISGRVMMREELASDKGTHKAQFDVASLASGTYIIYVRTEQGTVTEKFIRQ